MEIADMLEIYMFLFPCSFLGLRGWKFVSLLYRRHRTSRKDYWGPAMVISRLRV